MYGVVSMETRREVCGIAVRVNVKRRSCEEFERELEKLKFDNEGLKEKVSVGPAVVVVVDQ